MATSPNPGVPTATPQGTRPGEEGLASRDSLATRAAAGAQWLAASAVAEKVLAFGTTAVLARLLAPTQFGLYALAFVAIDALGALKNLGLDAAIVQRRDSDRRAADAAFLVLPLVSTSLMLVLFFVAPTVATWLGAPEVTGPLRGLGLGLVLMGLGAVPNALLQKRMLFGARVRATFLGAVTFSIVAISLALSGWGVWSLVVAYLARTAVTSGVCWLQVDWRPHLHLDRRILGEMLGFSVYVMAANLLSVVTSSADKVLVGRLLGPTEVGLYSLAYGLAFLFRGQIGPRLYQVAFPAFAEAQDDPERLRRGATRIIQILLSVAFPLAVLLALLPNDVLVVAYGAQWTVAAPVLSALAVGGVFAALNSAVDPLLLARGRSRAQFLTSVAELSVFLSLAPVAMSRWGLVGAGVAAAVSACVSALLRARIVGRDLELGLRDWSRALRAPLLAGSAMIAGLLLARMSIGTWTPRLPPIWHALAAGGAGLLAYSVVVWRTDPGTVRWLGGWVVTPFQRRRGAPRASASPVSE